jgi:transposase
LPFADPVLREPALWSKLRRKPPGDKLFVDYAGQTVPIKDRHTGASRAAQVFVAVLGFSNYTHAEATVSQGAGDWLGAHVRALEYFGGAPRAIVPDNLRTGVAKAHRYDPDINRAYQDFAEYYQLAVLPARVRKPRDKAKVESGVLVVERWILARLGFGPHKTQADPKFCMPPISVFYGDIKSGSFSAFASQDAVARHPRVL